MRVQILFAGGLLGVFLDGRQVDRLQSLDLLFQLVEPGLPIGHVGACCEFGDDGFGGEPGSGNCFGVAAGAQRQTLCIQSHRSQPVTDTGQVAFDPMPLGFQAAIDQIAGFQQLARFHQLLVDQQTLIEISAQFGF